jgi:tetratricopeptide (TPR) repeat protein
MALLPAWARAQQLTAQTILDPYVDDYGPKYQDVDTAISQLTSGRLADARASLATARRKNPNLPPANLMLAEILARAQQAAPVQAALEEAVKEDPADPGAYVYFGDFAIQGRRLAEAQLLYAKALDLTSGYTTNDKRKTRLLTATYSGLAQVAETQEDWPTARQHLEKLRQLDPNSAIALMRLGRVMFRMAKNLDEERAVFDIYKQVHTLDPKTTAYPDVNMALLYEQAGKTDNAKKLIERAAQRDSQNIFTMVAVAKWGLEHGELDMADQACQAALKLDPDSVEALIYSGLTARRRDNLPAAEEALKKAHVLSPINSLVVGQLSQVLAESSDEKKQSLAVNYARLGTQLAPDPKETAGREALVTMAWVMSRLKQDASAARVVQQALSAGDGRISADSGYYAAQILYNNGMTEASQRLLEQTLAQDPVFTNRSAAEQLLARIRNR